MGLVVDRRYCCPVCGARIPMSVSDDTLVLLEGGAGYVEHVVTVDDAEVHRCRLPGGASAG